MPRRKNSPPAPADTSNDEPNEAVEKEAADASEGGDEKAEDSGSTGDESSTADDDGTDESGDESDDGGDSSDEGDEGDEGDAGDGAETEPPPKPAAKARPTPAPTPTPPPAPKKAVGPNEQRRQSRAAKLRDAAAAPDDDARSKLPDDQAKLQDLALTQIAQIERLKAENANYRDRDSLNRRNAARLGELEVTLAHQIQKHEGRIRPIAGGEDPDRDMQVLAMPLGVKPKNRGRALIIVIRPDQMAIQIADMVQLTPQDDGFYLIG